MEKRAENLRRLIGLLLLVAGAFKMLIFIKSPTERSYYLGWQGLSFVALGIFFWQGGSVRFGKWIFPNYRKRGKKSKPDKDSPA